MPFAIVGMTERLLVIGALDYVQIEAESDTCLQSALSYLPLQTLLEMMKRKRKSSHCKVEQHDCTYCTTHAPKQFQLNRLSPDVTGACRAHYNSHVVPMRRTTLISDGKNAAQYLNFAFYGSREPLGTPKGGKASVVLAQMRLLLPIYRVSSVSALVVGSNIAPVFLNYRILRDLMVSRRISIPIITALHMSPPYPTSFRTTEGTQLVFSGCSLFQVPLGKAVVEAYMDKYGRTFDRSKIRYIKLLPSSDNFVSNMNAEKKGGIKVDSFTYENEALDFVLPYRS
eukprot:IDg23591t1